MAKGKKFTARKSVGGTAKRIKLVVVSDKVMRKSHTPSVTPKAPSPAPMPVDETEERDREEVVVDEEEESVEMLAALRSTSYSDDVSYLFFWRALVPMVSTVVLVMLRRRWFLGHL